MLRAEQNERLTQVSAGTAMGELLREFWLPIAVGSELEAGGPPRRTRVLGEDLVVFRSPDGEAGLVSAYCAHRCAPLWFGRNGPDGLQCTYHGWKFDRQGRCVEMPNEPPDQRFEAKVRLVAYQTVSMAGLVWAYMGSRSPAPDPPRFDWTSLPPEQVHVSRWLHESHWIQGMEGEIDNSHVPFLHSALSADEDTTLLDGEPAGMFDTRPSTFAVPYPTIMVRRTDSGLLVGSRRTTDEGYHWRVTRWWPPSWSMVGNPHPPFNGRVWIPIDDSHTMVFSYIFHPDRPLSERELAYLASGLTFPPETEFGRYALDDGYVIEIPVPVENLRNDYLIDRDKQTAGRSFTGIRGMNPQDRSVQDMMRPAVAGKRIVDRSAERIGSADIGVIAARRRLLEMADRYQQDGTLPLVAEQTDAYRGRSLDELTDEGDFDRLIAAYHTALGETPATSAGAP